VRATFTCLQVNADNGDGWRAILSACDAASPECVRLLIKHGADVNVISKLNDGWTPLMKACRKGDVGSARELIAAGADIKTCPKNGWGALLQVRFAAVETSRVAGMLVFFGCSFARNSVCAVVGSSRLDYRIKHLYSGQHMCMIV